MSNQEERLSLVAWAFAECEVIAKRSRDPSTKVGALLLRPDNTVASKGYNGFPRGIEDLPERYANRELKYRLVCHAEFNAITTARESVDGYTLYCTSLPCNECMKLILQKGIRRILFLEPKDAVYTGLRFDWSLTPFLCDSAGIELYPIKIDADGKYVKGGTIPILPKTRKDYLCTSE